MCGCVPVSIVSRVYRGQRKGEVAGSLELELAGDYEIPAWSWDLNPGPGEEQYARLNKEPLPQSLSFLRTFWTSGLQLG